MYKVSQIKLNTTQMATAKTNYQKGMKFEEYRKKMMVCIFLEQKTFISEPTMEGIHLYRIHNINKKMYTSNED